ncbi:hypothetical protein VPDG_00025 [Vibrio phage henriette 12B8]|uniref:hypothetical protein n=1 Tax=Vibrio phage henriette 12B8 TaxID=573174 RepID=UPI0002C0ABEB|nr:hypothetical protein VPDG_00025 [Vibrio phage henriette 12B8]AGG58186.1 hypothetical protein VPDG_00025 [Vibrio phage henriette 12B8]
MQIQEIQEMIVTGSQWYLFISVCIFMSCVVRDRYDRLSGTNDFDHDDHPFAVCCLLYAYYSLIWLPYHLAELASKLINNHK